VVKQNTNAQHIITSAQPNEPNTKLDCKRNGV